MDDKRYMLRHMLGTIAYRLQKALRDAPSGFADFRAGPGVRTPHQLILHITSVLGYARTFFIGGEWHPKMCADLQSEVERLHKILGSLKDHIEGETPLKDLTPERSSRRTNAEWYPRRRGCRVGRHCGRRSGMQRGRRAGSRDRVCGRLSGQAGKWGRPGGLSVPRLAGRREAPSGRWIESAEKPAGEKRNRAGRGYVEK